MEKTFCWSDFADFAFQNILQEAQKKNACYFSNLTALSNRKWLLIGGNQLPTRLSYLVWWLKFNENPIEVRRLA